MTSKQATDWDSVAVQLDDDAQRGKLAFVAAALMGAEDVARLAADEELVALIRAAISRALQERMRIGFRRHEETKALPSAGAVGPLPEREGGAKRQRAARTWEGRAYEDTPQRP